MKMGKLYSAEMIVFISIPFLLLVIPTFKKNVHILRTFIYYSRKILFFVFLQCQCQAIMKLTIPDDCSQLPEKSTTKSLSDVVSFTVRHGPDNVPDCSDVLVKCNQVKDLVIEWKWTILDELTKKQGLMENLETIRIVIDETHIKIIDHTKLNTSIDKFFTVYTSIVKLNIETTSLVQLKSCQLPRRDQHLERWIYTCYNAKRHGTQNIAPSNNHVIQQNRMQPKGTKQIGEEVQRTISIAC